MSPRGKQLLWGMIAAGVIARLMLAIGFRGVGFDIESFGLVDAALRADGLDAYAAVGGEPPRWPYLPAFFPFVLASGALSRATDLPFHGTIQIWPILADAAIAWIAQDYLGRRGAGERSRLLAAGLVALGPSFAVVSGFHGQFDSVAILPAVAALWMWDRVEDPVRRALICGALIGLGGAVKTVPMLMLLALLPSCRRPREGVALVGAALAVPLLFALPFLAAYPDSFDGVLDYRGVAGQGGLGLVAQPELAKIWLNGDLVAVNGLAESLITNQTLLLAVPLALLAVLLLWRRPEPALAATLLWLTVFAFSPNLLLSYYVWGLAFFIMAGYLRAVLAAQALLLIPAIIRYWVFADDLWRSDAIVWLYSPFMIAASLAALAALAFLLAQQLRPPHTANVPQTPL